MIHLAMAGQPRSPSLYETLSIFEVLDFEIDTIAVNFCQTPWQSILNLIHRKFDFCIAILPLCKRLYTIYSEYFDTNLSYLATLRFLKCLEPYSSLYSFQISLCLHLTLSLWSICTTTVTSLECDIIRVTLVMLERHFHTRFQSRLILLIFLLLLICFSYFSLRKHRIFPLQVNEYHIVSMWTKCFWLFGKKD